MNNYKFHVKYDGTKYNGWQRLTDNVEKTIQGKIERVISRVLEEEIQIIGSGRTDAGVHALMQVFNFKTAKNLDTTFLDSLNRYLPEDIRVTCCDKVDDRFHARHTCINKVYLYKIDNSKYGDPFMKKYSYFVDTPLDFELMKEGAKIFIGEHDFISFSKNSGKKKSTVKSIKDIRLTKNSDGMIDIYFEADGFLYNMVRMITGSLINLGLNKTSLQEIKDLLSAKTRENYRFVVPPQGLYLYRVDYKN